MRKIKNFSLIGAFLIAYVCAMIFLVPVRYIASFIELPPNVRLYEMEGSFWNGNAVLFLSAGEKLVPFNLAWRACLSISFPFYAGCIDLEHTAGQVGAKVVGWPAPVLRIVNLRGQGDIARLVPLLLSETQLALGKPEGMVTSNLKRVRVNLAQRKVVSWRGTIDIEKISLLNTPFPDIKVTMTEEPFITQDTTRTENLATKKLPTFKYVGATDKITVSGQAQFFEDGQLKHRLEATILDNSLRRLLRPLSTSERGTQLISEWQGNPFPPPVIQQ